MQGRSLVEIATGAAVLVATLLFLTYALFNTGRAGGAEGQLLTARFDKIDGLTLGADVKIAGVRVGSVTAVRIVPESFAAEISIRVERQLQLPADTSAEIVSEGLLGGKYISLVPGGADHFLADGGRITETQGSVSLESLLGRFIFSATQMNTGAARPSGDAPPEPAPAVAPATRP